MGGQEAEDGIEFVDRAIGLHTRVVLGDPSAIAESRLAGVAAFGVDAGKINHGSESS
jgi:hypothetical protein